MIGFALISFACGTSQLLDSNNANSRTFPIESQFQKFYKDLGGEKILGPAISTVFEQEGKSCQYVANAMICEDPFTSSLDHIHLEPIGHKLNVYEAPQDPAGSNDGYTIQGYQIYPAFLDLYIALGKDFHVGEPLSNAHHNIAYERTEQYFENVGFFVSDDPSKGGAALLPYGAFDCGQDCVYRHSFSPFRKELEEPIINAINQYGGRDNFGDPLTEPYLAADGMMEQVFEKVVIYSHPDDRQDIHLRPIPSMLGFNPENPVEHKTQYDEHFIFYTIEGILGFHVPNDFDKFILDHGDRALSGNPIFDPKPPDPENGLMYQYQCFENYCLEYHHEEPENKRAQLLSLGNRYLKQYQPENTYSISASDLNIDLRAEYSQVKAGAEQRIHISTSSFERQQPIANITPRLIITIPSIYEDTYEMSNTNSEGNSIISIQSAPTETQNSQMVRYQVCLYFADELLTCEYGSYLIWNVD